MTDVPELLAGDRQAKESNKSVIACNDYLRLGPGRSLAKLLERYQTGTETVPTKRLTTLKTWSSSFDWQARAAAYDATWEERKNAARQAEFEAGLGLDYERVRALKRLADLLGDQIYEEIEEQARVFSEGDEGEPARIPTTTTRLGNLWLKDVKGIGRDEKYERVEIVRFNAALVAEFRAALDDIAKEVGGRIQKKDVTTDGQPIIFKSGMDLDEL